MGRPRTAHLPKVSLLITDLDNTLFDWVGTWHAAFSAMLAQLVERTGLPQEQLEAEFRQVHQRYGTVEYAFALNELPSLRARHDAEHDLAAEYRDAIDSYRRARRATLRLYPGVYDALRELRRRRCLIVAYTESKAFYTHRRLIKLGLDLLIDYVYSPPDHDLPGGQTPAMLRFYEPRHYRLRRTVARHTPPHALKPNPVLLRQIIAEVGGKPEHTCYVGDSLMKDVAMAQVAEVKDAFAQYGLVQHKEEYGLLRRVTHWSDADVEREKALIEAIDSGVGVVPSVILTRRFDEVFRHFSFVRFRC